MRTLKFRGDPGTILLLVLSSAYLFPFLRILWPIGDEGVVVYGAQLVTQGRVPYRDFFVENSGPASFYMLALFFKMFGTNWFAERLALLVVGVLTSALIFWMTKRVYRGPLAVLPAVIILMVCVPIWPAASYHLDSNLWALVATAAFMLWQDTCRKWYLALSGALAGLTSCCMPQKGFLLLTGLLIAWWGIRRMRNSGAPLPREAALMLGGYATVGVVVLGLFWRANALSALIYDTVVWPSSNYLSVYRVPYAFSFSTLWNAWGELTKAFLPPAIAPVFHAGMMVPMLIIVTLPAVVVLLAGGAWIIDGAESKVFGQAMLPFWTAGIGLWLAEVHRPDWVHLIFASPLLLTAVFLAWSLRLESAASLRNWSFAAVAVCSVFWGASHLLLTTGAQTRINTRRGTIYAFHPDDALTFLNQQVARGEPVFVYPYCPMYYFLADVQNPSQHGILVYGNHTADHFHEAISALDSKQVRYILWDTFVEDKNMKRWSPSYKSPPPEKHWMENYIQAHYELVDVKNGFRIMRRKDYVTGMPQTLGDQIKTGHS